VILLGADADRELNASLLAEARRKGVQRILIVGNDGSVRREVDVGAFAGRSRPAEARSPVDSGLSYEAAFEEIFAALRSRLRLPADSFVPNRVLHVVGSLGPGGAERQMAYTAAGLVRRHACDVHVGCSNLDPPADFFKSAIEAAGVKISKVAEHAVEEYSAPVIVDLRRRLARYETLYVEHIFYMIFHYAMLIRAVRPTVVHTWMDYCNILAGIAAELVGVPALVIGGRSVAPDRFPVLFQPYMHAGYVSLLKRGRALFLNNSRAGAADYARWLGFPGRDFRVVHNGYEFPAEISPETRAAVRRAHGIHDDAPVVGGIIRFTEEKRPQLFLDMARVLHARHPDIRFLLFGSGPMLEEMRAYAEAQGLSQVVELPGLTKQAWDALAAMDVFVLTSRMEGLPNVMIEAQASGLPVVCTGAGGMTETFIEGETGYAVGEATAEALAEAVSRLICDPALRERMSERAFRHAREAFGIDRMVERTSAAYRDAYARTSGRLPARKQDMEALELFGSEKTGCE
jgi:glycosyltransferase involved in cell wall biosynthesis